MKKTGDGPIVAEVRATREKIAAECGYDIRRIGKRLLELEAKLSARRTASKKRRQRRPR